MKNICVNVVLLLGAVNAVSAQGELPVDMYTGTPNISVPLGTIASRDLADNIYLFYDARGVRVSQSSGSYGLGWELSGNSVSREVRSLPDDFTGTGSDGRRGWFYNNGSGALIASDVASFPNTSDLSPSSYDESSDYSKLASWGNATNGNYFYDTEPDVFTISFAGYSGKLVFDNSNPVMAHLVPYADIKVEVLQSGSDKTITGFRITTNNGNVYTFDKTVNEQRQVQFSFPGLTGIKPEYARRDFALYNNIDYSTWASYTIEWKLSTVTSPTAASLAYNYQTLPQSTGGSVMKIAIKNLNGAEINGMGYTRTAGGTDVRKVTDLLLSSIVGTNSQRVDLTYDANYLLTKVSWSDTRNPNNYVKEYDLTYNTRVAVGNYTRYFLATVTEVSGCDHYPPYKFSYINDGRDLPKPATAFTSGSYAVDFWGYYNGAVNNQDFIPTMYYYPSLSLQQQFRLQPIPNYTGTFYTMNASNRLPSAVAMQTGTLNNIQYPWGGSTIIQYEPHQYHDAQTNTDYIGGGLRVKSVVYFDGVSANSVVTKTFTYTDSTGASSGRMLWRPQYVIPVYQYREALDPTKTDAVSNTYDYMFVRSDTDLSPKETMMGSAVGYLEVKVARPGNKPNTGSGSVRHQYLMPGTYGDAATGQWTPATNKFARNQSATTTGAVSTGGAWMFPYTYNSNYDYERGLEWQTREYNQSGNLVRWTRNYYQHLYKSGTTPYLIYGVKYEHMPNADVLSLNGSTVSYPTQDMVFFFGKYAWNMDVSNVIKSQKIITYDTANSARSFVQLQEYVYGTTAHRLLTQVKSTSPDGTVATVNYKYPLDYGTVPVGADKASQMIGNLQSSFRNGTVMEQYSTLQKPGGALTYKGGSLVKFNDFGTTMVLPQYQLSLNIAGALTSFTPSYIDPTTKTFKPDPNYEVVQTNLSFDNYANATSSVGQDQITQTTGWGFSGAVPTCSIRNAAPGQFAFSDFETTTGNEFQISIGSGYQTGQVITGTGRTGGTAVHPVMTLTKTVQRAPGSYLLSFWLKKYENSSISLTVTVQSGGTTYYSNTTSYNPATSDFQYYELIIPIDNSLSNFTLTLQGNGYGTGITSSPDLLPMLDDVSLYPQSADLTSFVYTWPHGISATTTANRTAQTIFDNLGRIKYKLDQFKNILQKTSYHFSSDPAPALVASFTPPTPVHVGTTTFTAATNCIDGVTYEWNTGPGYVTGNQTQPLTFSSTGTYTVSLRVSHPVYGSQTYSTTVTVN